MTPLQLASALGCPIPRASFWLPHIEAVCKKFNIIEAKHFAAFVAQLAYESNLFTALEENLNYSAQGLLKSFHSRYTLALAASHAYNPVAIANHVYANRFGNGDEASGDGWTYRGRGLIQITFKDNYEKCGAALGQDFIKHPDYLTVPEYAAMSAGWFWSTHLLNNLANDGHVVDETRVINGGLNGLAKRQTYYDALVKLQERVIQ